MFQDRVPCMEEEKKEIIKETIKDAFKMKEKYSDLELNQSFQLFISQLDFFKTLATLISAIIGIGYVFGNFQNTDFLLAAGISSLAVIIGAISYTREIINSEAKKIKNTGKNINKQMDEVIYRSSEYYKNNDFKGYVDSLNEKVSAEKVAADAPGELIYADEIFTMLLYNSIFFILLGFFANKYNWEFISIQTALVLGLSYILGFKKWSIPLMSFISFNLSKINKNFNKK